MEVKCEFKTLAWDLEGARVYTCEVKRISIIKPETLITEFKGIHQEGKTIADVRGLWFNKAKVEFFPRGINKIFPNLKNLRITQCGLAEISKRDLIYLENLEVLDFENNKLKFLPNNLFINTPKLDWINFKGNSVEVISGKLFDPLNKDNLLNINFAGNPLIEYCFDSNDDITSLNDLIERIEKNCKPPERKNGSRKLESFFKSFEDLFTSGLLSDYTIKIREDEYKVHKSILAAQSSVFTAMFTSDKPKESAKMFKNIKNFSTECFTEFIRFFYTGEVRDEKNAMQLFQLACTFNVPELKLDCEDIIIGDLDELNMLEAYNLGQTHDSERLKRQAFEVIKSSLPGVSSNLMDEHELLNDLVVIKRRLEELQQRIREMSK